MSTAIAPVRKDLEQMSDQFAAALPAHVPAAKFVRTALTAIQNAPDVLNADRQSLYSSCMKAAADGLVLDGREAALVVFKTKDKDGQYREKVQYLPMVAGIIKRARNSGEISTVSAHVVYENDIFEFELGDDEHIRHIPKRHGDRGDPIGAYAIIKLKDGGVQREFMSVPEIEEVRAISRSGTNKFGPWVKWWPAMAEKTVLRRALKRAPMSTDLEAVLNTDNNDYQFQPQNLHVVTAPPPVSRSEELKQRLAAPAEPEEPQPTQNDQPTVAQVTEMMRAATAEDALNTARDLGRELPEKFQAEMDQVFEECRGKVGQV